MSEDGQAQIRVDAEAVLTAQLTMLKGYLRHLTGTAEDAEDLAQEICLEALKNPGILFRGADTGAYLRGIARHLASRHHRRIRRDAMIEEIIELAWEAHPRPLDQNSEHQALAVCLGQLPSKLRRMVLWRYDEGLNSTQIGERLSTSGDAVRMALGRARQALSQCIKQRLKRAGAAAGEESLDA